MLNLEEKVAIVTGSTGGIGASMVEKLAQAKLKLVIVGRRKEVLDSLAQRFSGMTSILPFVCDVTKREDLERLVKATISEYFLCNLYTP